MLSIGRLARRGQVPIVEDTWPDHSMPGKPSKKADYAPDHPRQRDLHGASIAASCQYFSTGKKRPGKSRVK
jgi:hypothetical protein